jgi:adenine phosphoribosyltransferase
VDDVISTGGSLSAAEHLLKKVGAEVVQRCSILAEGHAADRNDCVFLKTLPMFAVKNG